MTTHTQARVDAVPYVAEIMRAVARSLGVPVRELRVSADVENVLLKLIAKERADADQRLADLRRMLEAQPIGERSTPLVHEPWGDEPTTVGRRRRRVPSGTFAAKRRPQSGARK